jgi:nucleoside-diphosphate-sugar epimerase
MELECYYYGKNVLITGGAGFIGSHLVEQMLACGARVTILDNFSTGSWDNIAEFEDCITLEEGDVSNYQTCLRATKEIDYVFHLAAFVQVTDSFQNPRDCFKTNALGTFNLLEAARLNRVKRFISSSSSSVYGQHPEPCSEETPCNPASPYGYSKLTAEQYCQQYSKLFGLNTLSLRYFNVFGPRQRANDQYAGVVARFTEQIQNNQEVTIFGTGKQTRDFVPVSLVVEANAILALLPAHEFQGQAVNIATGQSSSILELFDRLKAKFNYQQAPQFAPARVGDIDQSQAQCSRYQSLVKKVRACTTF